MKLATLQSSLSERDGQLVVVSADHSLVIPSPESYPTLLSALEDWDRAHLLLEQLYQNLNQGKCPQALAYEDCSFLAPLPRTYQWLDGSAFVEHVRLSRKARGAELPEDLLTIPLMYQGVSDDLRPATSPIEAYDETYGVDFEGEFAVILSGAPRGVGRREASRSIALLALMNDVSLRGLIPREVKTGFGFIQGKPASSFAPIVVTPNEVHEAWQDDRLHLDLEVCLNGEIFGCPNGKEMHFSFSELIVHAARTRALSPGTVIGSGTVSNEDTSVGSCCIVERRMREKLEDGESKTPFLRKGDRVQMVSLYQGQSVFGSIDQRVE